MSVAVGFCGVLGPSRLPTSLAQWFSYRGLGS